MAITTTEYEEIANIIGDNMADTMVESRAVAGVARELADVFGHDIGFDLERFFLLCGLDEFGEVK